MTTYGSSASDRLLAVREAINTTLTAQSYSAAGRSKSMASLGELRKLEKELMDEIGYSGSMCSLGLIQRPSL
jgi:hypothetical protein